MGQNLFVYSAFSSNLICVNKLAAMQTFVTIVDQGSLTAAAGALGKALPTVVRSLATLEEALGVRLLRRTTRRMSLTEEGRSYLDRCRRILSDVEEAEQALSSQQAEPRGELRVTAPVLFGQLHVVPAVTSFLQRYDKVKVDLLLLDRVVNMVEEGIDVGVRIAPLADSSMIATRIGEVRQVVCASPRLLRRVGVPTHPRELAGSPMVHFRGLAPAPAWNFAEEGQRFSVPVEGPFTCNQAAASVEACAEGLGFGRFLSYQVESLVAAKRLRIVLEGFEPPPIPIHIVFAHARLMSPRIRVFVDWLKAHF
jgi:DNA-binding transcriptional LysR family regulator